MTSTRAGGNMSGEVPVTCFEWPRSWTVRPDTPLARSAERTARLRPMARFIEKHGAAQIKVPRPERPKKPARIAQHVVLNCRFVDDLQVFRSTRSSGHRSTVDVNFKRTNRRDPTQEFRLKRKSGRRRVKV